MKKITALFFFFLCLGGTAMAQSDFRPGFIITNAMDTIYGQIDYRGDQLMGSVCRFKANDNSPVQEFLPGDLYGYRFVDHKYFISREINIDSIELNVFLEYLFNGKMSVFYYRDENGDHYFVQKDGNDLVLLPYTEETSYRGNTPYLSKSKRHIGILKIMTNDAPVFNSRLESFSKPEHKNLIDFAEDYHKTVSKEEEYSVYEKKQPLLKISLEPLVGVVKYMDIDDFVYETGVHLFLWLPRANEKLYFKTGYLFNEFSFNKKIYKLSKFPLQFQYLYPKNAFRPKFNFGANFYKVALSSSDQIHHFHTIHLGTGFNYKAYKNLSLSTNIGTELTPLSTVLGEDRSAFSIFSYTFNIGAYISL